MVGRVKYEDMIGRRERRIGILEKQEKRKRK